MPSLIAALLLLGALFGRIDLAGIVPPSQTREVGGLVLFAFGVIFFLVMSLYSTWYLVDCLYADRKDRSVLFWKSLPISDTATVLSKLATALIVLPLVYFLAADITTLLIAFVISVRARAAIGGALWQADVWLQLQVMWIYLIVTVGIWYLPLAAWLMLISAWAKRAVTLWAILPPVAAYWAEHALFGTNFVGRQFMERLFGFMPHAFHPHAGPLRLQGATVGTASATDRFLGSGSVWTLLDPIGFFTSPATWAGLAIGALLIVATIGIRSRNSEI